MREDEYIRHDATALAELVRNGETTAGELLDVAMARLARWNPRINAVVLELEERASQQIRRGIQDAPFAGVPFLVKDLDGFLAGAEFTASSHSLAGYVPERDSELFTRYQQAGLMIFGKTNTPEFGLVGTTESRLRGPARNPWQPLYTPGGSSGGSAAAVAARIVPMAHGGDGGGSIRIPASACGLFGLKPSRGRTPMGPDETEQWSGLVQRHALTVTVRDSARLLDATLGADAGSPYVAPAPERPYSEEVKRNPGVLKIAFSTGSSLGRTVHPECAKAVADTAQLLSDLGHEVVEAAPPVDREALTEAFLITLASCTAAIVREVGVMRGRAVKAREIEPATQFLACLGESLPAAAYEMARLRMQAASRALAPFFEEYDVFVDATMAHPPARIGEWALPPAVETGIRLFAPVAPRSLMLKALEHFSAEALERTANTMIFNMSGQPSMSVPLAWSSTGMPNDVKLLWSNEGLPIGVQFTSRYGDEATLFRLAEQLEMARPWRDRVPQEPA